MQAEGFTNVECFFRLPPFPFLPFSFLPVPSSRSVPSSLLPSLLTPFNSFHLFTPNNNV
ncbi:hypothetical protein M076_3846 [Bacteroides fragilis str. 2-F-2 |uniref:Uncharacterized protein n=1 Tax=Bacteroides fragilis str. 2-F-2 \|nr:hypothetical protein M078_5095 [Bacteroides fragilis str. 2-F-2 \